MAGSFNKVILLGNLTRDVELRHLPSGTQSVANVGIAVNRRWRTPEGEQKEETTFVDCEAWGKQAETLAKYVSKGRPLFIEGRLRLDTWEKEGQKFSKLKVVIENFQFVDSRQDGPGGGGGGGGGAEDGQGYSRGPARSSSGPRQSGGGGGGGGGRPQPQNDDWGGGKAPIGEDDIPF